MRTKRIEMVEKEITTWKCDFCDFSTEKNTGCCGVSPINMCHYCKKDICREHCNWYSEDDWGDRPAGFYACGECNPRAKMAWELADQFAGRHDSIFEVTDKYFNDENLEEIYENCL